MSGNVGRPREFDEDQVLTEIMNLFWKQGYEGTGLSDIMQATGLQKGSLYKAYGSKRHMYVCSLEYYEKQIVDAGVKMLTDSETNPRDRIFGFLSAPIDARWNQRDKRGCFLCNASADDAAMDKETQTLILRGYAKLDKAMTVPVKALQPNWPDERVTQTAQLLLSLYSGLRVMARASVNRKRLEGAREAGMAVLD